MQLIDHNKWFLNRNMLAMGIFLLVAHVALCLRQFPIRGAVGSNPPVSGDLSTHLAHAYEGNSFIRGQGSMWGYSPSYMAGYPFGLWNSVGRRGYEMTAAAVPRQRVGCAFHFYVLFSAITPPVIMVIIAYVVARSWRFCVFALGLTLILYHVDNIISSIWQVGMLSFTLSTSLILLAVCLLPSLLEKPNPGKVVLCGILFGFAIALHPLASVVAVCSVPVVLFAYRKTLYKPASLLVVLAIGLITIVMQLPFMLQLWEFRELRSPVERQVLQGGIRCFIMDFFTDRRYLNHFDRRPLFHAVVLFAVVGALRREHGSRIARMLALSAGVILIFTYGAEYSKFLRNTQPYRYLSSALMFAIIPAVYGMRWFFDMLVRTEGAARKAFCALLLLLAPVYGGYIIDFTRGGDIGQGLDKDQLKTIEFLRTNNVNTESRVLCDDGILGNIIPPLTGRPVIGGTMSYDAALPHSWSSVEKAFRIRPVAGIGIDTDNLSRYCSLYNVGLVVTCRNDVRNAVTNCNALAANRMADIGRYSVYSVRDGKLTYVMGSNAVNSTTVKASPNKIYVGEAPVGNFVLKFHYLDTLRACSGVFVYPTNLANDPVPFIGIRNDSGRCNIEIVN